MVRPFFLAALAATTSVVQGHHHFVRLAHNGVWQAPLRYIRNVTDPFYEPYNPETNLTHHERGIADPAYYLDTPNSVRCGRGNMDHAAETETLKVQAGDSIEFVSTNLGYEQFEDERYWNCEDGRGFCAYFGEQYQQPQNYPMRIVHSGPISTYLSAVPEGKQIGQYDGSGEWTKIYTAGVEIRKNMTKPYWIPNNNTEDQFGPATSGIAPRLPFRIPAQTPAGLYLLRIDMVYNYWRTPAQLYPACAQIRVESSATGTLPKGVKFPETYDPKMPGMKTSVAHGIGYELDTDYVYPGGDLWTGEKMVVDRPDLTPV